MNIDLLFTNQGEAGLIASENFITKIAGVLYDPHSGKLTLEFRHMEALELNIPVEAEYSDYLDFNISLHIGAVTNDHISQAYQVPLLFSDDPYRNEDQDIEQSETPLSIFKRYLGNCVSGQPVHRENLVAQGERACVTGDKEPKDLVFAKHLARQYVREVMPLATPADSINYGLKHGLGPKK